MEESRESKEIHEATLEKVVEHLQGTGDPEDHIVGTYLKKWGRDQLVITNHPDDIMHMKDFVQQQISLSPRINRAITAVGISQD